MSESLSREQLLEYIKKQKVKIKKLEARSSELDDLRAELESLRAKQTDGPAAPDSSNSNDELEECFDKICALEEELEAVKAKSSKSSQESKNRIKLLENEVINLEGKVTEDGNVLEEHVRTIHTLKEAYNEKDSAFKELQAHLAAAQEAITAARSAENNPCAQCGRHEEAMIKLENTLSEYHDLLSVQKTDIDSQKQQLTASEERVVSLLAEISDLQSAAEASTTSALQASATITDLQSQLQVAVSKNDALLAEREHANAQDESNQEIQCNELKALQDQIQAMKKQLLDIEEDKSSCELQVQGLQSSLKEQRAEGDSRAARIAQLEDMLSAAHSQASQATATNDQLRTQLKDFAQKEADLLLLTEQKTVLEKQQADSVTTVSKLQSELLALRAECQASESRAKEAKVQVAQSLQHERDTSLAALSASKEAEAQQAIEKIQCLKSQLDAATAEVASLQPLRDQVIVLEGDIVDLRAQLERYASSEGGGSSKQEGVVSLPTCSKSISTIAPTGGSKKTRKRNKNKANASASSVEEESGEKNNSDNNINSSNTAKEEDKTNSELNVVLDKVAELERVVATLQQEKSSIIDASTSLGKTVDALQEEKILLSVRVERAEADLLTQKDESSRLLKEETTALASVISEKEGLLSELRKQVEELTFSLKQQQQLRPVECSEHEQSLQESVQALEKQLEECSAQHLAELDIEAEKQAQLRVYCADLQAQLQQAVAEHHSLVADQEEARAVAAANLAQVSDEATSKLASAQQRLVELEARISLDAENLIALQASLDLKKAEAEDRASALEAALQEQRANDTNITEIREHLSAATVQVATLTNNNTKLQAAMDDLQSDALAAEQATAATHVNLSTQLSAKEQQIAHLSSQLNELTAAASNAAPAIDQSLQLALEAKEQECKKAETTAAKYKQLVKSKMKEINDLTDTLKQVQSQVHTLEEMNAAQQQQITDSAAAMQEMQDTARDLAAQRVEERSVLLEQVSRLEKELESSAANASTTTAELADCQIKCAALEVESEKLTALVATQEKEIQQIKESTRGVAEQGSLEHEQRIQSLLRAHSESAAQAEVAISELKEELEGERKEVGNLKEAVKVVNANFTAKLEKERADTLAEQQALNAKIKRLKSLLTRSGTITKEKDAEIALLRRKEAAALEEKWSAFRVLLRVEDESNSSGLPRYAGSQAQSCDVWCLVVNESKNRSRGGDSYSDCPPGDGKDTSFSCQSKWILESQMSAYMQEHGQVLVGADAVPPLTLQQEQAEALRDAEEAHATHVSSLREEIAVVTQNFQAYKTKAHTALKRLGKDDHDERLKQRQAEDAEIAALKDEIASLREQIDVFAATETQQQESLRALQSTVDDLTSALSVAEEKLQAGARAAEDGACELARVQESRAALERLVAELRDELHELRLEAEALTNQLAAEMGEGAYDNSCDVDLSLLQAASVSASSSSVIISRDRHNNSRVDKSHQNKLQHQSQQSSSGASGGEEFIAGGRKSSAGSLTSVDLLADEQPQQEEQEDDALYSASSNLYSHDKNNQEGAVQLNTSNLMAVNEATRHSQETIAQLREDLSAAILERTDLHSVVALNEEQLEVLRDTVRELEASLARELEFNESSRTLNKEYLVNILRKFLMTKEPSEHAKLVPVLCSILHFLPEETKAICDKWALAQPRGGLLGFGWLGGSSGNTANGFGLSSGNGDGCTNSTIEDTYKVGSGGMDIY